MPPSAHGAPAQRVPAWKRLGLKLKPAASTEPDGASAAATSQPNGAGNRDPGANDFSASKRKHHHDSSGPFASTESPFKKARTSNHTSSPVPTPSKNAVTPTTLKKQKSVTFTEDTKKPADTDAVNGVKTPAKKPKGPKTPKKPGKPQPAADTAPALEYLRTWKTSRDSWKFNKNHQTNLIKRAFGGPNAIPSDDIYTFYEYIGDLKGNTRQRLRQTALAIRNEDVQKGTAAFPEGTMDVQAKQAEYDDVVAGILSLNLGDGAGSKRKRFDEVEFVKQRSSTDDAVTQRVIKRMRAESIVEELSDSDDSSDDNSDAATSTSTTTKATTAASTPTPVTNEARLDGSMPPLKLENETKPRGRRRKLRVAADDTSSDESSSDSESESDSDDGSDGDSEKGSGSDSDSSSSDDSDSDDEQRGDDGDSSDSSSSDSSDSSDDGGNEEDDDSDDESSDSEDEGPVKTKKAHGK